MHSVVAAPELFGAPAGPAGKLLIDADRGQLRVDLLEGRECLSVLFLPQPVQAPRGRQRRPALGVGEDARRRRIGAVPELGRQLRPVLDDDQLDQRRGVEVEDQARCSVTRSETEPAPFTCAERGER